jgi:hypothetical protein
MPSALVGVSSLCSIVTAVTAAARIGLIVHAENENGENRKRHFELANPREGHLPLTSQSIKSGRVSGINKIQKVRIPWDASLLLINVVIMGSSRCRCRVVGLRLTKRFSSEYTILQSVLLKFVCSSSSSPPDRQQLNNKQYIRIKTWDSLVTSKLVV